MNPLRNPSVRYRNEEQKVLEFFDVSNFTEALRKQVSVTPSDVMDPFESFFYELRKKSTKAEFKICCIVFSVCPTFSATFLHEALRERYTRFSEDDKQELSLFFNENWEYNRLSITFVKKRQIFGLLGDKKLQRRVRKLLGPHSYRFVKLKKPRRTQRRRGYRDHGSLGPLDERVRRKEFQKDFSSTQLQNEIEEKRQETLMFQDFLAGFYT